MLWCCSHLTKEALPWKPHGSSTGMYSQHYACTLIPKTQGSATLSPPSQAFSSNFTSCLHANIRNYDPVLRASWCLRRVCELARRIHGFPLRIITLASSSLATIWVYSSITWGGNLISMITNTITQTWDRTDLRAVHPWLGFVRLWSCLSMWNMKMQFNASPSRSMSGHAGAKMYALTRAGTVELCMAYIRKQFLNVRHHLPSCFLQFRAVINCFHLEIILSNGLIHPLFNRVWDVTSGMRTK